jgi:hypothetical protein
MKLSTKAELALIARFKQHPALANVTFRQQAGEAPKRYGDIIIACKQGEENAPPSGVYDMEAEITLLYPVRLPAGDSLSDYSAKCSAIEEVLTVHWKILSEELTATRDDWHCYEIRVTGSDSSPTEKAHQAIYSCKLIAMGQTHVAAAKLKPVL